MNEKNIPQIFNFEDNQVRTTVIEGEAYFVGRDVAIILGYSNPQKAVLAHVDNEDKGVTKWDTLGGKQNIFMGGSRMTIFILVLLVVALISNYFFLKYLEKRWLKFYFGGE